MSLRRSKRLRRDESPVRDIPTKVMKSLNDLPEEIILKIAKDLSRDLDLIAFSHVNLRTFQIISKAFLLWKERLDAEDQNYCMKMKSEFGTQEWSCPEKEMFFRRSNSERNIRKANFRILDDRYIDDKNLHLFSPKSYHSVDFYVHHSYNPDPMNIDWVDLSFLWVDLSKKGGPIQTGILSKKMPDRHIYDRRDRTSRVFAATKSILIIEQNTEEQSSPPYPHSLFAIDISRPDNLHILWEHNSLSNVRCKVCVANLKIYKSESSPDNSSVISILSVKTGQTLSTWSLGEVWQQIFKLDF